MLLDATTLDGPTERDVEIEEIKVIDMGLVRAETAPGTSEAEPGAAHDLGEEMSEEFVWQLDASVRTKSGGVKLDGTVGFENVGDLPVVRVEDVYEGGRGTCWRLRGRCCQATG